MQLDYDMKVNGRAAEEAESLSREKGRGGNGESRRSCSQEMSKI